MHSTAERKIQLALKRAMQRTQQHETSMLSFVTLDICDHQEFAISITRKSGFILRLSSSCPEIVECLANSAGIALDPDLALEWLMLHELSHISLSHFELADEFGVAQRYRQEPHTLDVIRYDLRHLAPLCLEMQADHEATDILLGAYIADGWDELREKVLAISGMMMLIELEDAKNAPEGRTHPKAATRIFQLLGHLAEMPLIQAQVRLDTSLIPSENELQAFSRDVTIPCFFDAVQLAQAAGAVSIANNLGDSEDFFKDLEIAKLGDPSHYGKLKTQGAREWAKLWPCNEALKPILCI